MKKVFQMFMMFVIVMMASTVLAQGRSYDLDAVATSAEAALSRVGAIETDLAAARSEVQTLKIDLATLKASRSASAGALRRTEKLLAAAQAKVAELEKQAAADGAGVQKHALTTSENIVRVHLGAPDADHHSAPTDPVVAATAVATAPSPGTPTQKSEPLAQRCPNNTSPRSFVAVGRGGTMGSYFACDPVIKSIDLTVPAAKPRTMPLWLKYASFIASGAAIGGAGTYAVNRFGDGAGGAGDVAGGAVLGAVGGAAFCALTELF